MKKRLSGSIKVHDVYKCVDKCCNCPHASECYYYDLLDDRLYRQVKDW